MKAIINVLDLRKEFKKHQEPIKSIMVDPRAHFIVEDDCNVKHEKKAISRNYVRYQVIYLDQANEFLIDRYSMY